MRMKKDVLLMALSALSLTACVNDETIEVNRGDEVAFRAVAGHATRTEATTTATIKEFKVWGFHENEGVTKTFMDAVAVNRINDSWTYSPTQFWPEAGTIDFFSVSPGATTVKMDKTTKTIPDFTVLSEVDDQIDLLYAANYDCSKEANGVSGVEVNFRHALSQIVFQAKNINPNLYVEISGVSVCKLGGANTFTYPSGKTDSNIVDHEGTAGTSIDYVDGSWGTWGALTGGTEQYNVTFTPVKLKGDKNATASSLTNTNETGKEFSKKALLLLPQTTTAWDVTSAGAEGTAANQSGSYFLVKCKIYNVANSTTGFDPSTDVCLWPGENSENPDNIAIPVAVNWEQGKKYIYTFVFGEGNGGYDPEPDPDDPDPEPVLIPIKFDVTVDDFVPVANEDIEMDEPDNN